MENFKVDKSELERFKSAYHAQTGEKIDNDMALFYFEITRDRKLVIDISSNTSLKVDSFMEYEKEVSESMVKNILNLQKGVENLALRTEEKRASFLSVILRFYHNRSVFMRYVIGFLFFILLAIPSYLLYLIYVDFQFIKSNNQSLEHSTVNIKGHNFKASHLPEGAYVKKNILYIPIK